MSSFSLFCVCQIPEKMLVGMNFQCILAAIIVVALKGMFKQFAELKRLWNISIIDFVSTPFADLYVSNHFPVSMLGLIQMRFGYVQLWPVEASWCARIIGSGSGRMQPACYRFPTFRLSYIFPKTTWVIMCKTSLYLIQFW